jgi:uncharacterized protein (DUF58 family)
VSGLLALAGVGLVAALLGRPELAVLAAPLLVFVGVGLALAHEPQLEAEIGLERTRLLEGEHVRATVTLRNNGRSAVECDLGLARTSQIELEPAGRLLVRIGPNAEVELQFSLRATRWGAHAVGPLMVRARDPLGITVRDQRLGELVAPLHTQPFLGAHVARSRGDGIEFADVRSFNPGDRVRQINWRATARRGAFYVNDQHPEQASDLVLLLDTFEEAREGLAGTLDAAVRAAASLARAHLGRRDRVALVDFGGTLHWLQPAFGTGQLYRIIDALLASEIAFSYAWREVESIPRRILPAGAQVLAVTPLLDDRSIRLITDLHSRGYDLTVVEVSPLSHTSPGSDAAGALAYRLWGLQREALRARLRGFGIAVAQWDDDRGLGPALEGVNSFRRSIRHVGRA